MFASEFKEKTTHFDNDNLIDITMLMNKYDLSTTELFYYMYKYTCPFGMGVHGNKTTDDITSVEKAETLLSKRHCFDYYNGVAIKNCFRASPHDQQIIDMKKYDERNAKSFYYCILSLLKDKLLN